jgi:hypothetical protein
VDVFPSVMRGWEIATLKDPLEIANPNHWTTEWFRLKDEDKAISVTFLETHWVVTCLDCHSRLTDGAISDDGRCLEALVIPKPFTCPTRVWNVPYIPP